MMNKHLQVLFSILSILLVACNGQDCHSIEEKFENYQNAIRTVKSGQFEFSDNCDTSKSSWIYDAEFYSCDGKTGYFIIETKSRNYIHSGVPIGMWSEFKNADSFGKYYNRNLKGRFRLIL